MNITTAQIKKQYDRAKAQGWIASIQNAAEPEQGVTTAFLLAIGSRETNLDPKYQRIAGDNGHGFSLWQLDIRSHKKWIESGAWKDVGQAVRKAVKAFLDKRAEVFAGHGRSLSVRGRKFIGKQVDIEDARRIATAAYNSGLWGYYHFSNGNNVDTTTTGKDYSRDVYDRAIEFAKLLEEDGITGALSREIQLQGKYARESHIKLLADRDDSTVNSTATSQPPTRTDDLKRTEGADKTPAPSGQAAEPPKAEEPPVTVGAGTSVPPEPAKRDEAIIGGRPQDPPKEAAVGGRKSLWATISGVGAGTVIAVLTWLKDNANAVAVCVICVTLIVVVFMFRQLIMDYLRVKMAADPTKYNVK